MITTRYILLNKEKKISNRHQITDLICFPVFIINFGETKSNFPLSGPYLSHQRILILIRLESLGCYAIQNVSK